MSRLQRGAQVLALGIAIQRVTKPLHRLFFLFLREQLARFPNRSLRRCLAGAHVGFCFLSCDPLLLQPFALQAFAFSAQTGHFHLRRFQRRAQILVLRIALQRFAKTLQRLLFLSALEQLARFPDRLLRCRFAGPLLGFGFFPGDTLLLLALTFEPFALRLPMGHFSLNRFQGRMQFVALGVALERGMKPLE